MRPLRDTRRSKPGTDMIVRWVTDPKRFTEVAATLAETVSSYADANGGWKAIADQWLQPGGLNHESVYVTSHLLSREVLARPWRLSSSEARLMGCWRSYPARFPRRSCGWACRRTSG